MFTAIFDPTCPFAAFMRKNPNRDFVRAVDYVRYAAMDYNRDKGYSPFDVEPRRISFHHIHVYDERNDLNEIAYMTFINDNRDKWIVTIVENEE